ncbi:MAG: flagellar biosynthesis repressor FlbT [Magnetospirillum sp.]|nr:flagellar biosynthesis repressor FlbT [Magnetospirillum sp.]
MPLLIDLKPGEKVIINGAVIENAGTNTKIRIHNESNILRQKEILIEDEANTPASRVYFCLQCAYIFPEKRDHHIALYERFLSEYIEASPSATGLATEIRAEMALGHYYKALKASRKLLKHEGEVLDYLQRSAEQLNQVLDAQEAEASEDDSQ